MGPSNQTSATVEQEVLTSGPSSHMDTAVHSSEPILPTPLSTSAQMESVPDVFNDIPPVAG